MKIYVSTIGTERKELCGDSPKSTTINLICITLLLSDLKIGC
jgi:hypothetical protein